MHEAKELKQDTPPTHWLVHVERVLGLGIAAIGVLGLLLVFAAQPPGITGLTIDSSKAVGLPSRLGSQVPPGLTFEVRVDTSEDGLKLSWKVDGSALRLLEVCNSEDSAGKASTAPDCGEAEPPFARFQASGAGSSWITANVRDPRWFARHFRPGGLDEIKVEVVEPWPTFAISSVSSDLQNTVGTEIALTLPQDIVDRATQIMWFKVAGGQSTQVSTGASYSFTLDQVGLQTFEVVLEDAFGLTARASVDIGAAVPDPPILEIILSGPTPQIGLPTIMEASDGFDVYRWQGDAQGALGLGKIIAFTPVQSEETVSVVGIDYYGSEVLAQLKVHASGAPQALNTQGPVISIPAGAVTGTFSYPTQTVLLEGEYITDGSAFSIEAARIQSNGAIIRGVRAGLAAPSGKRGAPGASGATAPNNGANGAPGSPGGTGQRGADGRSVERISITANYFSGDLTVDASGQAGGSGGDGGQGGLGGVGGRGRSAASGVFACGRGPQSGGNGGNGGIGGAAGSGGDGGDAAAIFIKFADASDSSSIRLSALGGEGGTPGSPGAGGQGGPGGARGASVGFCFQTASSGRPGIAGSPGINGNNGRNGTAGEITVSIADLVINDIGSLRFP
ncbi:MAG: collagen-like protein [Pseudomonadota bacterium]